MQPNYQKQFRAQKAALEPGTVLLFRVGDFYETFDDDAETLANVCGTCLTRRGDNRMAGVPYHMVDRCQKQLVTAGHKVALVTTFTRASGRCRFDSGKPFYSNVAATRKTAKGETMTEKQLEAITRHGQQIQAIFRHLKSDDPVSLMRRLRRIEREANATATAYCNGEIDGEDWEREAERLLNKLNRILDFKALGVPVFANGDARGYTLKIDDEWMRAHEITLHRDWGGYGIIAPEIGPKGE